MLASVEKDREESSDSSEESDSTEDSESTGRTKLLVFWMQE